MVRLPVLLVTSPKDPLVGLVVAPPSVGWFSTLKASHRKSNEWWFTRGNLRRTDRLHSQNPGCRGPFRGCTPKVPAVGWANASRLNHTAESVNSVRVTWLGSPT